MENLALAEPGARTVDLGAVPAGRLGRQAGDDRAAGRLDLDLGDHRRQAHRLRPHARRAQPLRAGVLVGQSLEELYRTLADRKTTGMGAIFVAAMREWKKSFEKGAKSPLGLQTRIDKAMDLALTREMERLEGRLGFLATIGSAAPFIGLFGTVVGIMTSFQAIAGSKSTNLAVVAPGIAEALLATAIGLLAAIPAVIAYNKLSSDAGKLAVRMEGFADEFSAILSRQIDEKVATKA